MVNLDCNSLVYFQRFKYLTALLSSALFSLTIKLLWKKIINHFDSILKITKSDLTKKKRLEEKKSIKVKKYRCEQGSNLRGKIPLDFKSNALTTRPSQLICCCIVAQKSSVSFSDIVILDQKMLLFIQLQTTTHHAGIKLSFRLFNFLVLLGFFRVMFLAGKLIVMSPHHFLLTWAVDGRGLQGIISSIAGRHSRANGAITWCLVRRIPEQEVPLEVLVGIVVWTVILNRTLDSPVAPATHEYKWVATESLAKCNLRQDWL